MSTLAKKLMVITTCWEKEHQYFKDAISGILTIPCEFPISKRIWVIKIGPGGLKKN